jgi:hypothetical protein
VNKILSVSAVPGPFNNLCFGAALSWCLGWPLSKKPVAELHSLHRNAMDRCDFQFLSFRLQNHFNIKESMDPFLVDLESLIKGAAAKPFQKQLLVIATVELSASHVVGVEDVSGNSWLVFDPFTDTTQSLIHADLNSLIRGLVQKHGLLPEDCVYQWLRYAKSDNQTAEFPRLNDVAVEVA